MACLDIVNFSQVLSRSCLLVYLIESQRLTVGSLINNKEAQKIE
jgi:hypothetical protein